MILNRYVSEIKEFLGDLDDRFIIDQINQARAIWIKNELNKGRSIDDDIKQTLTCIELDIVEQSECPFVISNSYVLKSKVKIPKTIIRDYGDSILAVRNSKILSERYNYVSKEHAVYANSGKMNRKSIFAFLYNDYMYIKISKENPKIPLLTRISIEGIFEDPTELAALDCCGDGCYDILTQDYPISYNLWVYIKSQLTGRNEEKG